MLTRPDQEVFEQSSARSGFSLPTIGGEDMARIMGAVRRQRLVVVGALVLFLVLGIAFALQSFSQYSSSVAILIDSKKVGMSAQSSLEGSLTFESGAVDSQVQVLLSEKIAGVVADKLNLANNPEFLNQPGSYLAVAVSDVSNWISERIRQMSKEPKRQELMDLPAEVRRIFAVRQLLGNIRIARVGRTYVLGIEYTDRNPQLATAIAGAYAEAYLDDQLESKYDATRRASVWMDDRIQELKVKALAADQAVQEYRNKNNLTFASGRLVNEQALTEASTQLSMARSELASAQARFDRLRQITDAKQLAGAVAESLGNPLINQLRQQYLTASKTESEISAKLGPTHQAAENARKDMAQYERLIFSELQRIQQSTQSDVQIAKDKLAGLERSIATMRESNASDNEAQVKLRSLEQESQTYNTLYTSFLQKYQLTTQQESFPVTDARVITPATIPLRPSSPRTLLIVVGAILLGLVVGAAIGALREFRDRGFRTGHQVRQELGLEFIANLPFLTRKDLKAQRKGKAKDAPEPTSGSGRTYTRATEPALQYAVENPLSRYTEGLRAVKIAADLAFSDRQPVITGFVSMFPNEGKSTAAKNYASLLASQGLRTLLIDGDLRNPELTRLIAPRAMEGLVDAVRGGRPVLDLIVEEDATGLRFLPGATHRRLAPGGDLLGSSRMRALLNELSPHFDQIVIDLPPVGAVTDAAAISALIDGYIFVIEWGATPRSAVREALINEPGVADRTLGVILSKVQLKRLHYYNTYANYGNMKRYGERYYGQGNA